MESRGVLSRGTTSDLESPDALAVGPRGSLVGRHLGEGAGAFLYESVLFHLVA
jgi:hypothetical protein